MAHSVETLQAPRYDPEQGFLKHVILIRFPSEGPQAVDPGRAESRLISQDDKTPFDSQGPVRRVESRIKLATHIFPEWNGDSRNSGSLGFHHDLQLRETQRFPIGVSDRLWRIARRSFGQCRSLGRLRLLI
jgi:hypothetical protein